MPKPPLLSLSALGNGSEDGNWVAIKRGCTLGNGPNGHLVYASS